MHFKTVLLMALSMGLLMPHFQCTATPENIKPASITPTPKSAGGSLNNLERESYSSHSKLRAAKILRGIRFKGNYENAGRSYIEFHNQSNFIYIKFGPDYRHGKITDPGKSGAHAMEGTYWIQTWKQQNYVGFKTGPSRKYFKNYFLKWKVEKARNSRSDEYVLKLRVFSGPRSVTSDSQLKEIHSYTLRGKQRSH